MAARPPLVLGSDGRPQELQIGDTILGPVTEVDVYAATNDNAGSITQGQAVYISSSGGVDLADASTDAESKVVGLVADASIASAATGSIQTNGLFALGDWTSITGSATLTPNALYFLSETAGQLTATPITTSTAWNVVVGIALSNTELQIRIKPDNGFKRR